MFIDKEPGITVKLRRSEILLGVSHISLLRSWGSVVGSCYKHPAPMELSVQPLRGVLFLRVGNTISQQHINGALAWFRFSLRPSVESPVSPLRLIPSRFRSETVEEQ